MQPLLIVTNRCDTICMHFSECMRFIVLFCAEYTLSYATIQGGAVTYGVTIQPFRWNMRFQ